MIASQWLWSGEHNRMEIIWSMCMRDTALLPLSIIQLRLSHPIGNRYRRSLPTIPNNLCSTKSALAKNCKMISQNSFITKWGDYVFNLTQNLYFVFLMKVGGGKWDCWKPKCPLGDFCFFLRNTHPQIHPVSPPNTFCKKKFPLFGTASFCTVNHKRRCTG